MKLLLFTTFLATVCYVSAGKTRLLAALLAGQNAQLMAGLNGGMLGVPNAGLLAGVNGPLANAAMLTGGLNQALVAGGAAGLLGQQRLAQFAPGPPAFAVQAPVPNMYQVPAVNMLPFVGVPQIPPLNPPQQLVMGNAAGAMPQQQPQQQLPVQLDPARRFRRQLMKEDNVVQTTEDPQILTATETTPLPCDEEGQLEDY